MRKVKALIITGFGINTEEEMSAAYRIAGAESKVVHLNDILLKGLSIHDFDIITFPGGFSFGDDISSGKILANKIKYKKLSGGFTLLDELKRFIDDKKYILGVCNGFQVLVKLGLLPDTVGKHNQEISLSRNDSGKFEDRWCYCKVASKTNTPFLKNINTIKLPVRHGEGKLIIGEDKVREDIINSKLNCLSYADSEANITSEYPYNPNGSQLNCAGLTDKTGHILGMMPHPEAYISIYNNPEWNKLKRERDYNIDDIDDSGEGLKIFKNIVEHIEKLRG